MTRNPNLVATPTVDKNGKVTTVYRRTSKPSGSALVPAPRGTKKVTPEETLQSAIERLADVGFLPARTKGDLPTSTYSNLSDLAVASPETMNEMVDHIVNTGEVERKCWEWTLLANKLCHTVPTARNARSNYKRIVRTRMILQPLVAQIAQNHPEYSVESSSENIIYEVQKYQTDRLSGSYDDEAQLKAAAIHLGIKFIASDSEYFSPLEASEEASIDFIAHNIEAVEAIVGELARRRTSDPDVIRQLTDTHAGLVGGIL